MPHYDTIQLKLFCGGDYMESMRGDYMESVLFDRGFDAIDIVPVFIVLVFLVVFGVIIYNAVKGGMEWNKNNNSPILTVGAKVVAKRIAISNHGSYSDDSMLSSSHTSTTYFMTFELESGDRMELKMPGGEYGVLVEGDTGNLTFQGTRYKGFERTR
jgi:hypothetical protein